MTETWAVYKQKKIIPPKNLVHSVADIKSSGKSIATLNGSFDLLHAGHLHILFEASKRADVLIVALNTDHSIQRYKSPKRPIIPLEYRIELIAALESVTFVTWFDQTDPCTFLSIVQPDVHVNGAEYGANCVEAQTVHSYGGKLHLVELLPGLSTSQIIKTIIQNQH